MYKVQYKSHNAAHAWSTHGTYGSEASAMGVATHIASNNFMVRVVVWSG